jgi:hypothetical protein
LEVVRNILIKEDINDIETVDAIAAISARRLLALSLGSLCGCHGLFAHSFSLGHLFLVEYS